MNTGGHTARTLAAVRLNAGFGCICYIFQQKNFWSF